MNVGNVIGFLIGSTATSGTFLVHKLLVEEDNSLSKKETKFEDILNEDQIDVHKFLWSDKVGKNLIDYFDYDNWIKKAKEFSIKRDKWPSDIIFIEDKSDKSLGEKLRNKCYETAKWFPQKSLNDNNVDIKNLFESVDKNFKFEDIKQLCSTEGETKSSSIKKISEMTLSSLTNNYTCSGNEQNASQEMKEYYQLKKEEHINSDFCTILKQMIVSKIEYSNESMKYEIWKSRKNSSGSFEIVPGTGNIYASLEEIPGFSSLFTKNEVSSKSNSFLIYFLKIATNKAISETVVAIKGW